MYFIANTARAGGRIPSCYGPYPTKEEAQVWAAKMQPGVYIIYGPAEAIQNVTVASPQVTTQPISQ